MLWEIPRFLFTVCQCPICNISAYNQPNRFCIGFQISLKNYSAEFETRRIRWQFRVQFRNVKNAEFCTVSYNTIGVSVPRNESKDIFYCFEKALASISRTLPLRMSTVSAKKTKCSRARQKERTVFFL